jgi:5-methylthioadenosine/S-adenosylhomocysteine deaminase
MKKVEVDLLLYNGTVLTLVSDQIIENGFIAITGGRIVAIGQRYHDQLRPKEAWDLSSSLVMPGLINAHTHAAMVFFRGLADDLPLMEWLEKYIFPAERKNVNEELVYLGTLLACAEMIRSGTTTFCDMYIFEKEVAQAAKKAGMRAVVGEVLYDFPSPNVKSIDAGLQYTADLAEMWKDDPLIIPAVEPHSTYTCSPGLIKRCEELSNVYSIPLIIHLSETESEIKLVKEKHGLTPVFYLDHLGVLNERLIADHCVKVTEDEMDLLKRYGVKVVHCPESNMKLASGVAPVPELLAKGVVVGLGTDGCASNNNLDMFQEMDTAAKLHKVYRGDPTAMNAISVVKMATINGAKVLGLENDLGSIEVGKKADLIIIDLNKPHLTPLYNHYSQLVYAVNGSDVTGSIIDGRVVMRDGKLTTIDEKIVMKEVRRIARNVSKSVL